MRLGAALRHGHAATTKRVIFVGLLAAVLASACGGGDPDVELPAKSGAKATPATSSASPQEAIKAAYLASGEAYIRASRGLPEHARSILREYNTGWYLDFLIRRILTLETQHQELWGAPVRNVTHVSVSGRRGTLYDCQDARNSGLADSRTHQLLPGTQGTRNRQLVAQLSLGDDNKWRVTDIQQRKNPC